MIPPGWRGWPIWPPGLSARSRIDTYIIRDFGDNYQRIAQVNPYVNDFIELQALRLSIFPKGAKKTVLFPAMIT
jgi:hypothetical protein